VFEGIEFYIPQVAHMIIHLEVDWPTAALEQFVLIVCQHSLHFALQLHFILVGAMEDYQLETSDGKRSAHGNPRYYRRCAKLLQVSG
jgi:phosphatidylinositol 4-kinase B